SRPPRSPHAACAPLAAAARTPSPLAGSPRDDLVSFGLRDGLGAYLSKQRVDGKVRILNPLARLRVVGLGAIDAGVPDLTKDAKRIIDRPRIEDQGVILYRHPVLRLSSLPRDAVAAFPARA